MLGIGQAQALPQALDVLGDHDGKRAKPAHRACVEAASRLELRHVADGSSRPDSAIATRVGTACAATRSFNSSMRTRSRDSLSSPSRARMHACNPSGSGGPAP